MIEPDSLTSLSNIVTKDSLSLYEWFEYKGKVKKTVTHRTHIKDIVPGQVYGLRAKKRADGYYLIFPEFWNIPFSISDRDALNLQKRSSKKRVAPKLSDPRAGRVRAVRQTKNKTVDTGSDRYKPAQKVRAEKQGTDLSNYQWRKLISPKHRVMKTNKIGVTLERNTVFGVRFKKPAQGGVIVLDNGQRFGIPTEKYDKLMEDSVVLPLSKWRTGILTPEDLEKSKLDAEEKRAAKRIKLAQEKRQLSIERKQKKMREDQAAKLAKAQEKEAQRQKLEDQRRKAVTSEKIQFSPSMKQDPLDNLIKSVTQGEDDLLASLDEIADDEVDIDMDDLEVSEPDSANETVNDDEVFVDDADQDAVDAALDSEIDEVRQESRKIQLFDEDDEEDVDIDSDDQEDEEAPDLESMDEQEVIDLADELGLGKLRYSKAKLAVADFYDMDVEDTDEDQDEPSLEDENEDAAIDEALDSDEDPEEDLDLDSDSTEDQDTQDADSDDENPETETKQTETEPFEEGTVVTFNEDKTEQREFVILDIYNLKNNDKITVYKVYDVDADDETFQTVRVRQGSKTSIEKMATKVRQLNAKQFAEFYNRMEAFEKSNEPLTS